MYEKFKPLPIVLEGPEFGTDYSYFLVANNEDLKSLEKSISVRNFEAEVTSERDPEMEYRILTRINCHKIHY